MHTNSSVTPQEGGREGGRKRRKEGEREGGGREEGGREGCSVCAEEKQGRKEG